MIFNVINSNHNQEAKELEILWKKKLKRKADEHEKSATGRKLCTCDKI